MKHSTLRSVLTNASHLGAARFFNVAARTLYVVVLARLLGPELYGLFAYTQAWYISFIPITALGGLFLFNRNEKPDRDYIRSILPLTLAMRFSLVVIVAVTCGVSGWLIESDPEIRALLALFTVALLTRAVSGVMNQLFVFYEEAQIVLRQEALFRSLELAAGISVLMAGGGIFELGLVHTASWALQAVRAVVFAHKIEPLHLRFAWAEIFHIIASRGLAAGLGTALLTWLVQGPLVLSRHSSVLAPHLGDIALTLQAFSIAAIAPMAVTAAAYPVLVRSIAREDSKDVTYVAAMCRATILFGAFAGLSGFALGPAVVTWLLGDNFALAGELLGYSMWLIIPHVIASSAGPLLIVRGLYGAQLWRAVFGVGSMVISFPYFVDWLGPLGVILSAGLGLSLSAVTQMTFLVRTNKLDLNLAITRPSLAAGVSLAVYLALEGLFGPVWALVGGLLALLASTLAFAVFTAQERRAVLVRIREMRSSQS